MQPTANVKAKLGKPVRVNDTVSISVWHGGGRCSSKCCVALVACLSSSVWYTWWAQPRL